MRLIDADALKASFDSLYHCCGHCDGYGYFAIAKVLQTVNEAPTIDAKPVAHGEIIEIIENGKMKRVFSCCNAACTQLTMWINPNYCPNCGAKMDGGKET